MEFDDFQIDAVNRLKNGSILCGDTGSGKSRTSLVYYFIKECGGEIGFNGDPTYKKMSRPKDLYIITTARKRDKLEWEGELLPFLLSPHKERCDSDVNITIDSWNNIQKYTSVCGAFFIFDEQRVVGTGAWVKSFIQISKKNTWLLLSATPGDCWIDYVPVFIAHGFYKNRNEFIKQHVIYRPFVNFPQIDRYINTSRLDNLKEDIVVYMKDVRKTEQHHYTVHVDYDKNLYKKVHDKCWDIYNDEPIENISGLCSVMRKVINLDDTRLEAIRDLIFDNPRLIIFYNFDYELEKLRSLSEEFPDVYFAELNGHKHMNIPTYDKWVYLVQYAAGAEGWNCTETNVIAFYSQSYSYRMMKQAAGRIDRMNTTYRDLHYYHLVSKAPLDLAIENTLRKKRDFNARDFSFA